MGKLQRRRHLIQAGWAAVSNGYLAGYLGGGLYQGPLKALCVPGMNCYSCPGALGSCPIGSLQAVLGSRGFHMAFYVTGFLLVFGALFGRLVCGFLCPFGLVQDLLYKIPFVKKIRTFRGDKPLRWLKYLLLAVFVILLPLFAVDVAGQGSPAFCKWICPVGALEGGIPQVLLRPGLHDVIGWLYAWKMVILAAIVLISVVVFRPFCKYLCPLGAIYGLCNPVSLARYRVDENKCTHCQSCVKACPMGVNPLQNPNHRECIRCGACREACPTGAISLGLARTAKEGVPGKQ